MGQEAREYLLLTEKLKHLLAVNHRSILTFMVVAVVVSFTQYHVVEHANIFFWLGALSLVSLFRVLLEMYFNAHPKTEYVDLQRRLNIFRVVLIFTSLIWGLCGYLLYPEHSEKHQMLLLVYIMGMSAGVAVVYSIDFVTAIWYAILLWTPMLVRLLIGWDTLSLVTMLSGVCYLLFIGISLHPIGSKQKDNILLRADAIRREQESRNNEERHRLLLTHSPVGIFHYNFDMVITYCNQRFADMMQNPVERLVGLNMLTLKDEQIVQKLQLPLQGEAGVYEGQYTATYSDANLWVRVNTAPSRDAHGNIIGGIAIVHDMSVEKKTADEVHKLAFYDPLTNLPNRRLLMDRLQHALVASQRTGRYGALLFIDLDQFKTLNDTLGHDIGDMLLQQVGERLLYCVREGDTVARLGGDEYVAMLEDLSSQAVMAVTEVEVIGQRIINELNHHYKLREYEYHTTPSIGVVIFGDGYNTPEEVLKHADIAMYQAKKAGRNMLRYFDPTMQETIDVRARLETSLRKALDRKEFCLYYQVQVDSQSRPIGAEALLRWNHPEQGLLTPDKFIALAEETGLIVSIGAWVIQEACVNIKRWQQVAGAEHLTLSVNVSPRQLMQPDFVAHIKALISRYAINPHKLRLELTESMLLDRLDVIINAMTALSTMGVQFSLDDFGTGYSSLQYLKMLPLHQLKIDQTFVRDIEVDSNDEAIIRTIIAMAKTLDLNVIAEGVETGGQREILLDSGCPNFQGYLYSRPLPLAVFERQLLAPVVRESENSM